MGDDTLYKVATCFLKGIGSVSVKKLIAYLGGVEAVFNETEKTLAKIPEFGIFTIRKMDRSNALLKAKEEIAFMHKNDINFTFYTHKNFPKRLLNCIDSPVLLFYKGRCDFNKTKILSIVGTRSANSYGYNMCENIISQIKNNNHDITIVSGLAYGIDIKAHRQCLKNNIDTIAVLAHGLDIIYPSLHKIYAEEILMSGGAIVSEYPSSSKMVPANFVQRNRIVAGMSDATVVVQSPTKGGSLITAEIANSYNRDVFAFPGRVGDKLSAGCNMLIKTNKAVLLESVKDLEYVLNWEKLNSANNFIQQELFVNLSNEEEEIINILNNNTSVSIDSIFLLTNIPINRLSSLLLKMEFDGLIFLLPGKIYALKR